MRIVHILYLIPGLDGSGGAEQALAAMAGPLRERGVQLDVVTFTGRLGLAGAVEEAGGTVRDVDGGSRVALARRIRDLTRSMQPDLVHTTLFDADVPGRLGGRLAGVPVVSSLVNVAYGPEQRSDPALSNWKLTGARWADRLTARIPVRFHALSPHVASVMGARLAIPAERIDVIPRGRDPESMGEPTAERRARVRRRLGVDDDRPLVVAAARHEFQKGLDVLVRAWPAIRAAVPDAELRIGGRAGGQSARIARLLAQVPGGPGGEPTAIDIGPRDDVPDLLVAADAFVVPSRWEGLGSVLVEAMALGAPVVASRVGPVPDLVGDGWARLVPPDDPGALAAEVVAALGQPADERRRRAAVARGRFLGGYALDVVADAMVAFYERALAAPAVPSTEP